MFAERRTQDRPSDTVWTNQLAEDLKLPLRKQQRHPTATWRRTSPSKNRRSLNMRSCDPSRVYSRLSEIVLRDEQALSVTPGRFVSIEENDFVNLMSYIRSSKKRF
ncbi:hypothetical protein L596_023088 [Steinernema carpocapsae]|uniref:Uncharacterized protein n=1 Tax=Steinernema carpocapsae TaxID=34508 RepID=A0A4U5MCM6_STECR|nr:hypothetical protein L596_023088 [Steinernema carpocapsae]